MVFLVKRDLALPVRPMCRFWNAGGRPTAQMYNFNIRNEKNSPPSPADRGTEVDVFRVHEVSLVEQADRFSIAAAHEQTGAAHPVRRLFAARRLLHQSQRQWPMPRLSTHQQLL